MEDKHFKKLDSWYFSYLRRVIGVKASYYSRICNTTVWKSANHPTLLSQLVLSQQFQLLVGSVRAPSSSPLHHVIFSRGYRDRSQMQKKKQRGKPPRQWLGLTTKRALESLSQEVTSHTGYSSTNNPNLLTLTQFINKIPDYPPRLVAAPTRNFSCFSLYSSSIDSAWRS